MMSLKLLLLSCCLSTSFSENWSKGKTPFPDNFMFGVSTAAYQIEGGWNEDGKGENIWDHMCHTKPDSIIDQTSGDVACDSYHNYMKDINMLLELGVNHYRFSISWSRILPTGFSNKINPSGVNYYRNIIKLLKENNIEPMVTIYHWDLPQTLQEAGGWTNPFIIDVFVDYARLCFELFGDEVKYWLTVNEPIGTCLGGFGLGTFAPGVKMSGTADYWCTHNILRAHAKAWHLYDKKYRPKQKGKISLTIDSFWYEPASSDPANRTAAETAIQFLFGWYVHPIFNGDYPAVMKNRIAKRSKLEGFHRSRLPAFTKREIEYIKGTYDFLGYNFYTSYLVKAVPEPKISQPSFFNDLGVELYQPSDWKKTAKDDYKITPWGFRKILKWIKDNCNNPEIIVTENGLATNEDLNDSLRIYFLQSHLSNLQNAMTQDKVRVTGYTAWTLMDDFEWGSGYTYKFGLFYTNFSDPQRTRIPRKSVEYYKKVISTHRIPRAEN